MTEDVHSRNKAVVARLNAALYDFDPQRMRAVMDAVFAPDAALHMCHPFGEMTGPRALFDQVYIPLHNAVPDLEQRLFIRMAGRCDQGHDWVGLCGYFTGVMVAPWLDIPPTGHVIQMRFHEFYRIEDGVIVEMQAIWDIPELMMQAGAWPMAPSLGREGMVQGPATQDGIPDGPHIARKSAETCDLIKDMLAHMIRHPAKGGPEVMEMERFWHPRMMWYGPAGIGTARGIAGFRDWHQIPFLAAMPDRGQAEAQITHHFFGDRNYAAVTGWPNMRQTLTADGWLGIAPAGKSVTLRSLDFWRVEKGVIRENWVLVDLLDVFRQLDVDVFARLGAFNKARNLGRIDWPGYRA